MNKSFDEVLHDGFEHITEITDPVLLKSLRDEGYQVDLEGYYVFSFGEGKEYEWRILPIGDDGYYVLALFRRGIRISEKLPVRKN